MQRTVIGNLAADPEIVNAGNATLARFAVVENTGEFRKGEYQEDDTTTSHNIEAWFELGDNIVASLTIGNRVIVVGTERTDSYMGEGDKKQYKRVIKATHVGPDLGHARATVTRIARGDK